MRAQTELDRVRAKIRQGLRAHGTNVEQNDGDPTGDGDQSPVHLDENGKQFYRDLFAEGGDLNECVEANVISTFGKYCVSGNARAVKSMLQEANNNYKDAEDKEQAQPSAALIQLLETRETSMRFSPLLMVVSMGKNLEARDSTTRPGQLEVVRLLLEYGARPDAKDVCGKTVCHYGAGAMATIVTLEAVDMCMEAAESNHFFEKEVELHGLMNACINGQRGIARGFHVARKRREVCLFETKKTVAAKSDKMRLVADTEETQTTPRPKLCDIPDRLGGVCMLEVFMTDRRDVMTHLLDRCNARIDVADWDGYSPQSMALTPGLFLMSRTADLVKERIAKDGRAAKMAEKRKCTHCEAAETPSLDMMKCSKCKRVQYCSKECQKTHWKKVHKKECESLATDRKDCFVLDRPTQSDMHTVSISHSLSSSKTGVFRKPSHVAVGEKFYIKIQGSSDMAPLLMYDESREFELMYTAQKRGFHQLLSKVKAETCTDGRKTYMKASFDEAGDCTVYTGMTTVKPW
jgi:hypothetical protein